jgi:hypothetical protein
LPLPFVRTACAALVVLLVVFAGGCATVRRKGLDAETLLADGQVARAVHRRTIDGIVEGLARRAVRRGDGTLDVLYLSGGGQNGAYGAGFLRGWKSRASEPMPVFDLVTGVSAGAIQAPFALLGTEASLDTAAALFGTSVSTSAPKLDPWFWLFRTGGVLDVNAFERAIRRTVDGRTAARLRAAFAEDRQLAIATTDYDLGVGRLWDAGRELEASPAGLERLRDLIVASSSIPGAFPPRILDRHVHLDGGVIANLAAPLDLATLRALSERLGAGGPGRPLRIRFWVVMNLWTHIETSVMNPSSRGSLSRRTTLLLYMGQQPRILQDLETLSRAVAADLPGLRLEVRHTAIPSELAEDPAAKALADEAWMSRLEKLGYERARSASPWDDGVPGPYERPALRSREEK